MKRIPFAVLVYLVVGGYYAVGKSYTHNELSNGTCVAFYSKSEMDPEMKQTLINNCTEIGKEYDEDSQRNFTREYHEQVTSRYFKFLNDMAILKSRIKKGQVNLTFVDRPRSFDYLEIVDSGHLLLTDTANGNFSIDDKMNLDSSSISINLTKYVTLDDTLNETRALNESLERVKLIVSNEIVWVNQSVTINGSCCMIANVSLAPGQQLFATDLTIIKDNDGAYLGGSFSWGFIHKNESNKNVSGVVTFTKTLDATNSVFFTPSYQLDDKVNKELNNQMISGNISFRHLELETVKVDPEHATLFNSLFFIQTPGDEIVLCLNNFTKIKFPSLSHPQIGKVNLLSLLTYDTDQSTNSSIRLKEIQLDGFVLSKEHQFAQELADKLSKIVKSSTHLHYDNLTLKTLNVTNLSTDGWNDFLLIGSNVSLNLRQLNINGSVTFSDRVNDFRWDHDLISVDGTGTIDQIDCSLIFADQLIISDDLASKSLERVMPNNWTVDGDLTIDGWINGQKWNQLIGDLVDLTKQTDSLVFGGNVEAAECNFAIIDDIDSDDLLIARAINDSLTFKDLGIVELVLDQVAVVPSCLLNGRIESNETNSIDTLNVINLSADGTINDIELNHFLINRTSQDFTKFNGSLITSNVSFKNLLASGELPDCETPKLNGLVLNRLLRADPELKWPETVILKSSNITNFSNPSLIKSFSNLLNNSDQEIDVDFSFHKQTEFTKKVHVLAKESSINIRLDLGSQGDINWSTLNIYGNLTAHQIYILSSMKDVNISKGISVNKGLTARNIKSEPSGEGICADGKWKVYQQSTISNAPDLIGSHLTIDNDLTIAGDNVLPWLKANSLDGIDYYQEVVLDKLNTNFKKELTYDRLESDSMDIQLEDITNSVTDPLPNLQFDGDVTIRKDFTSDSDVDMNLLEIHV